MLKKRAETCYFRLSKWNIGCLSTFPARACVRGIGLIFRLCIEAFSRYVRLGFFFKNTFSNVKSMRYLYDLRMTLVNVSYTPDIQRPIGLHAFVTVKNWREALDRRIC